MLATLEQVQDSALLASVHSRLRDMVGRRRDKHVSFCFPLPASIGAKDLERLQRHGQDMIALPKDDGTRVMMLCMTAYNQPRVFLVMRNGTTFHLIVQARASALQRDTLLDCELCQLQFSANKHVVHIMDAHIVNGERVHRRSFVERMRCAQQWLDAGQLSARAANVEVRVKTWVWAKDCLRVYQNRWSHESEYGLKVDGVIFVHNKDDPMCTDHMFKWKPQQLQTIDLLTVYSEFPSPTYNLYAQDRYEQHVPVTPNLCASVADVAPSRRQHFKQDVVQFTVNVDVSASPSYLLPSEPQQPMSSSIVEYSMHVDPTTLAITLTAKARRGHEKTKPNSLRVVARTVFDWLDGLTLRQVVAAVCGRNVHCPDHLRAIMHRQNELTTGSPWPGGMLPPPQQSSLVANLTGIISHQDKKDGVSELLTDLSNMLDAAAPPPPPPPPPSDIGQVLDDLGSMLDCDQQTTYHAGQGAATGPSGLGAGACDFPPPTGPWPDSYAGTSDFGPAPNGMPVLPRVPPHARPDRGPHPRHPPAKRNRHRRDRRDRGRHAAAPNAQPADAGRLPKRPKPNRASDPVHQAQPPCEAVFEF